MFHLKTAQTNFRGSLNQMAFTAAGSLSLAYHFLLGSHLYHIIMSCWVQYLNVLGIQE